MAARSRRKQLVFLGDIGPFFSDVNTDRLATVFASAHFSALGCAESFNTRSFRSEGPRSEIRREKMLVPFGAFRHRDAPLFPRLAEPKTLRHRSKKEKSRQ